PLAGWMGAVSQDRKEPSSRTMSTSSGAFRRGMAIGSVLVGQPGYDRFGVLVEQRRGLMPAAGGLDLAVAGGVEEPQRRAGQVGVAEHLVVDGDLETLGECLVPLVDLGQGAHRARGDARLGQCGEQLL